MKFIRWLFLGLFFLSGFSSGAEALRISFQFEKSAFSVEQRIATHILVSHFFSGGRSCEIRGLMKAQSEEEVKKRYEQNDVNAFSDTEKIFRFSPDERFLPEIEKEAAGNGKYLDKTVRDVRNKTSHKVNSPFYFGGVSSAGIPEIRMVEITENRENLNIIWQHDDDSYQDSMDRTVSEWVTTRLLDILQNGLSSRDSFNRIRKERVTTTAPDSFHKDFSKNKFFYYVMEPIGGGGGGGGHLQRAYRAVYGVELDSLPERKALDGRFETLSPYDIEQKSPSVLWPVLQCATPLLERE